MSVFFFFFSMIFFYAFFCSIHSVENKENLFSKTTKLRTRKTNLKANVFSSVFYSQEQKTVFGNNNQSDPYSLVRLLFGTYVGIISRWYTSDCPQEWANASCNFSWVDLYRNGNECHQYGLEIMQRCKIAFCPCTLLYMTFRLIIRFWRWRSAREGLVPFFMPFFF